MAPPPAPSMPPKPNYDDKADRSKAARELKQHTIHAHIASIGISPVEDCFPDCPMIKKTCQGLPLGLTPKQAFTHVLEGSLSTAEKRRKFIKCRNVTAARANTHQRE